MTDFKPCFVIPSYNHGNTLRALLGEIKGYDYPCIVVDDGSDADQGELIREACAEFDFVELNRLQQNQGKGGAVIAGIELADQRGFSHAIQIDSDGQHDIEALSQLISESKDFPDDVVSGLPVYSEDIPKGRLIGRYITHFWVWVETLSTQIKDSMCGFRSYPIKTCIPIFKKGQLGKKMDFDVEILVRSYWSGANVRHVPVRVSYPEDGSSNFRMFKDNLLITWMHTRLFFSMLPRVPKLLFRKNPAAEQGRDWYKVQEVGSKLGMRLALWIYRTFGKWPLVIAINFVVMYYYLTNKLARAASRDYLQRYKAHCQSPGREAKRVTVYRHIYSFASMVLDKFAVWDGKIALSDLDFPEQEELVEFANQGHGHVFVSSHFGNLDVCRALMHNFPALKIDLFIHTANAQKFNSVLKEINQDSQLNLISVTQVGPGTAIQLQEKIDAGHWIFIMGDRASLSGSARDVQIKLLGSEAKFPLGPFILADILETPVRVMHCYRQGNRFTVRTKQIAEGSDRSRKNRNDRIKTMMESYVRELEACVEEAPLQWFNFFKFWDV